MDEVKQTDEKLGKFGHHPDPAIDFEVEIETIQSLLYDATHGVTSRDDIPAISERISKAMDFRVGGDPGAVAAKHMLRDLEKEAAKQMNPVMPARPLMVEAASSAKRDQFWVKGKAPGREWREQEVSFSGYFGSYGPELFAAAPDLREALKLFVRSEKMARDGHPPQGADELIKLGEAALSKASPSLHEGERG